jgi:hypothetical protein
MINKILEYLFKWPAYMPFPEIDMRPLQKTSIVYAAADPLFTGGYAIHQLGDDPTTAPPKGPHYKHRRFWFFKKRKGWTWGNKLKNTIPYSKLGLEDNNAVGRFSQRCRLLPSTQMAAFFNVKTDSVVVDLDMWEEFLKKPLPGGVSYEVFFGFEPDIVFTKTNSTQIENTILEDLLK